MKLKIANTVPVLASEGIQSSKMGLAQESGDLFSYYLRDKIYTDKVLAVVREYITNAIDEHTKHDIDKDIEVAVRYEGDEWVWSCRDFGKGLSKDGINNIFGMYGRSTKRKDDTNTGMYGIGSKSGHAYSDTFFINSHFEGVLTKYVCILGGEEGGLPVGRIYEVSSEPTDETGIEISLFITNDRDSFISKTREFVERCSHTGIRFDSNGIEFRPLVPTESKYVDGYSFHMYTRSNTSLYSITFIYYRMGNIVYRKCRDYRRAFSGDIVVDIPLGKMTFPLSREHFEDTKPNNDILQKIDRILDDIHKEETNNIETLTLKDVVDRVLLNDETLDCIGNNWAYVSFDQVYGVYKKFINYLMVADSTSYLKNVTWFGGKPLPIKQNGKYVIVYNSALTEKTLQNWKKRLCYKLSTLYHEIDDTKVVVYPTYFVNRFKEYKRFREILDQYGMGDEFDNLFEVIDIRDMKLAKAPDEQTTPKKTEKTPPEEQEYVYTCPGSSSKRWGCGKHINDYVIGSDPTLYSKDNWWMEITTMEQLKKRTILLTKTHCAPSAYCSPYTCNSTKLYDVLIAYGWVGYNTNEYYQAEARLRALEEERSNIEKQKDIIRDYCPTYKFHRHFDDRIIKKRVDYKEIFKKISKEDNLRGKIIRSFYDTYHNVSFTREELRTVLRMK